MIRLLSVLFSLALVLPCPARAGSGQLSRAIAVRNLPIHHPIGPGDLREETVSGLRVENEQYVTLEEALGKRVRRPVSKGTCLKAWHLQSGDGMARGDAVMIVLEQGAIRIEARGTAVTAGKPGETIRVLNVGSGKEILASVVDSQTVAVSY